MDEFVSTFLTITLVLLAIFIAPVTILASRIDDSMQTSVNETVTHFVDRTRAQGYITRDDYMGMLEGLSLTGNTYEISLYTVAREYYHDASVGTGYTAGYQTLTQLEMTNKFAEDNGKGRVYLNTGDYIFVEVKQTNKSLGQRLTSIFAGGNMPGIFVRYGGRVGGRDNIENAMIKPVAVYV